MSTSPHTPPLQMDSLPEGYRALVLGAGGGLGQAFCEHLSGDPRCGRLAALGRQTTPAIDLLDDESLAHAAAHLHDGEPWHLLIVATGVLHGEGLRPEKRLADLNAQAFARVLAVNTVGPAMALRHFIPLMDKRRSLVGLLSAKVGSIGDNRLGGWTAYRASKAALNMVVKTTAIECARTHKGLVLAALHPGTVRTALSQPFNGEAIGRAPQEAAGQLLTVLNGLQAEDSGSFRTYANEVLPW